MFRLAVVACLVCGCNERREADPDAAISVDAPGVSCTFVDEFTGTVVRPEWELYEALPDFRVTQQDALRMDVAANVDQMESGVQWREPHTLEVGTTIDVEVPTVPITASTNIRTHLRVSPGVGEAFVIRVAASTFGLAIVDNGFQQLYLQEAYDPVIHRWWRIAYGPGDNEVTFSTSPDGISWVKKQTLTKFVSLINVKASLVVGSYAGGEPTATYALFDNFKLCPPATSP